MKLPFAIRHAIRQWKERKRPRAIQPMEDDAATYRARKETVPKFGKKWKGAP